MKIAKESKSWNRLRVRGWAAAWDTCPANAYAQSSDDAGWRTAGWCVFGKRHWFDWMDTRYRHWPTPTGRRPPPRRPKFFFFHCSQCLKGFEEPVARHRSTPFLARVQLTAPAANFGYAFTAWLTVLIVYELLPSRMLSDAQRIFDLISFGQISKLRVFFTKWWSILYHNESKKCNNFGDQNNVLEKKSLKQ